MRRSAVRTLPVVALAALAMVLPGVVSAAAYAGNGSLDVQGSPLTLTRLAPGSQQSGTVVVHNDSAFVSRLDLRATDVVEEENSCEPQERQVPTEQCAADGGELGGWLTVTVSRDDTTHQVLWTGTMQQLQDGATLSEAVPAGASWPLRLGFELPFAATNDTMTDSIRFGLHFVSSSQDGVTEVSGPQVDVGGGSGQPGAVSAVDSVLAPLVHGPRVGLPMTGATISLWMLLLDLALIVTGAMVLVLRRRSGRLTLG